MADQQEYGQFKDEPISVVREQQAGYDNAEMDLLREGLSRSYKERLLFATMLYKVQQSFKKARIISRPDNLSK